MDHAWSPFVPPLREMFVKTLEANEINDISTAVGFQPSTASLSSFHRETSLSYGKSVVVSSKKEH